MVTLLLCLSLVWNSAVVIHSVNFVLFWYHCQQYWLYVQQQHWFLLFINAIDTHIGRYTVCLTIAAVSELIYAVDLHFPQY